MLTQKFSASVRGIPAARLQRRRAVRAIRADVVRPGVVRAGVFLPCSGNPVRERFVKNFRGSRQTL
jgi:hypothetical protein